MWGPARNPAAAAAKAGRTAPPAAPRISARSGGADTKAAGSQRCAAHATWCRLAWERCRLTFRSGDRKYLYVSCFGCKLQSAIRQPLQRTSQRGKLMHGPGLRAPHLQTTQLHGGRVKGHACGIQSLSGRADLPGAWCRAPEPRHARCPADSIWSQFSVQHTRGAGGSAAAATCRLVALRSPWRLPGRSCGELCPLRL